MPLPQYAPTICWMNKWVNEIPVEFWRFLVQYHLASIHLLKYDVNWFFVLCKCVFILSGVLFKKTSLLWNFTMANYVEFLGFFSPYSTFRNLVNSLNPQTSGSSPWSSMPYFFLYLYFPSLCLLVCILGQIIWLLLPMLVLNSLNFCSNMFSF